MPGACLKANPPHFTRGTTQLPQSKEWCQGKRFDSFGPIQILNAEDVFFLNPDWQVPLVKRTFASADETHIRVWGPAHWLVLLWVNLSGYSFCIWELMKWVRVCQVRVDIDVDQWFFLDLICSQSGDLAKVAFPSNRRCGVLELPEGMNLCNQKTRNKDIKKRH